ncbi:hypothetical protein TRICI_003689 [Trichomonascus ciferrii]|uniref:Uncharacterized protein n=1 Tax=Trichomonascus ciferrii TaxID=44093 RepID=A0A642V2K6_9ASCO|nr:hypothetical protein TRICI_003689 [Trichomonascus ciferrii]
MNADKIKDVGEERLPSYNETIASSNTTVPPPEYGSSSEATQMYEGLRFQKFGSVPDKERVICHLKLLRLFYNLRTDVENMDGLFDLYDEDTELGDLEKDDRPRMTVREKRWEAYVYAAVDRFELWWEKAVVRGSRRVGVQSIKDELKYDLEPSNGFLSLTYLPPLDVVMVWHAFMTNPRMYAEECFKSRVRNIWNEDFPWGMLDMVVDSEFNYNATNMDKRRFTEVTGLPWDLLDGTKFKLVECFHCSKFVHVPLVFVDREGVYQPERSYISPAYHGDCGSCKSLLTTTGCGC